MNQTERYIILFAQIVTVWGFLLGLDATFTSGTNPFIKNYHELTGSGVELKLGWSALLSCGLPILAALSFTVLVLQNQQQPAVILKRPPGPQRRLPLAGSKE